MHATRPTLAGWQRKTNVSHILGERCWGGGYQEGDGAGGRGGQAKKIVKGMERDESRKQEMGEDRDGERHGGIMRGKEVENDSPSLQTTPCW